MLSIHRRPRWFNALSLPLLPPSSDLHTQDDSSFSLDYAQPLRPWWFLFSIARKGMAP